MSAEAKEAVFKWSDWLFKTAVTVGTVVLILLRTTFATKEDLEKEREQRRQLGEAVLLLTQQRDRINDFEARIRSLEARRVAGGRSIDGYYEK